MSRGRNWVCLVLGLCGAIGPTYSETPNLKVVHEWGQLEFDYPSASEREKDIQDGLFTPGVIAPIDMDVYYSPNSNNNEIFVTIPRFQEGIPATLGTVTSKTLNGNPLIKPYPEWSWHRKSEECHKDRIVSVFRTKIDECGRLWVLDTGKIGPKQLCRPQIIAFNLNTNQILHRHEFSETVVSGLNLLVTPEVDVRDVNAGCRNTFIYIADVVGFSLIVYDVAHDTSWQIKDKSFFPFPSYGTYTIEGESFELMDGILGLALSPYIPGHDRVLFYHAMSSPTENWVYTSHIRNHSLFKHDPAGAPDIFHTYSGQRNSQSAAEAVDKDGIMIFGLIKDSKIACWNTGMSYGPSNFDIIASNRVTLQFPSGIKIIRNKKGEQELYIMTSRFQKVANGSLDPKDSNFRIQAGKVEDLLFGTRCRAKLPQQNLVGTGGDYGHHKNKS